MSNPKTQIVIAPAQPAKVVPKREIRIINGTPQFVDVKPKALPRDTNDEPSEKIKYVNQDISRRIINARNRLGLTQIQFAQKAGININVLRSYENGSAIPNSMELKQLGVAAGENFRKAPPSGQA